MSPTSYQAAPPRTSTIADAALSVKFCKTKSISLKEELPGTVGSAVAADRLRAGMYIVNACAGLLGGHHRIARVKDPIVLLGDRVGRDLAQVASLHEILKRLRSLLFIQGVAIDGFPHRHQVFFEHSLAGMKDGPPIQARGHADQNDDDGDYDHQLDQGEATIRAK